MNREIKTTLALDGEQKFKREIADAKKNLANLGTQLTLAAAQFKNDNDAMKLVEARSKALRDEITQQETIVKALSGAVKESSDIYGANSDQVAKWQAEMNRAAAKLENLRHELNNNEQGLDKNGKAFADAAASADNATGAIDDFTSAMADANGSSGSMDFLAFDTALKNVESDARKVYDALKAVATGAWDMVSESSAWADDLITLSTQTGISMRELQRWSSAARYVDTDADKIVKGMDDIRKKAMDGSEETAKLFNTLKVRTRDASGNVRDAKDLFWDTVDALHNMSDKSQRAALAQKIFGNNYKELMPLIEEGRKTWEDYGDAAEKAGLVLTDDQINKLGAFNDALQKIEERRDAFKNLISAGLADGMQSIADKFAELQNKANAWAQSEEGQEALKHLSEAITSVVDALTKDVDFNALVTGAAEVLTKIGEALSWAASHPETVVNAVKTGLVGIAAVKGLSTAISLLTTIHKLASMGASGFNALGSIFDKIKGLGGVKIDKSVTDVLTGAGSQAAKSGGSTVLGTAASIAGKAAVAAPLVYAGVTALDWHYQAKETKDYNGGYTEAQIDEMMERLLAGEKVPEAAAAKGVLERIKDGFVVPDAEVTAAAREFAEKVYGITAEEFNRRQENPFAIWDTNKTEAKDGAKDITIQLGEGLKEGAKEAEKTGEEASRGIAGATLEGMAAEFLIKSPSRKTYQMGLYLGEGLADGIDDSAALAVSAAQRLADAVAGAIEGALDIHSPSRVMARLGAFVSEGFAEGIEGSIYRVDSAINRMVAATAQPRAAAVSYAMPAHQGERSAATASAGSARAVIMMDKYVVGELVYPIVNEAIQADIEAVRR